MTSTTKTAICTKCGRRFIPTPNSKGKFCGQACYQATPKRVIDLSSRFWRYVHKTEDCWLWTGVLKGTGRNKYGILAMATGTSIRHKNEGAHRVSWKIHFGEIPPGMFVCHRCDNPQCVRPDHLFLGTNKINMQDMAAKGRGKPPDNRGSRHGMSRLTEPEVVEIRLLFSNGSRACELAERFGVALSTIYSVTSGRHWMHVT